VSVEAEVRSAHELRALGYENQGQLLRDMAAGLPLPRILENVVRSIESRVPDMLASVLLVQGDRLRLGAAPSLPDGYNRAADDHPIGEGFGSCGTAAHRRQLVVVEDIATDPLWKNYREIASRYQLGACWSMPVLNAGDEVVGTFALYHERPRRPRPDELALIRYFSELTAFAIEHHQMRGALRERDRELLDLVEDLDGIVWRSAGETRRFDHVSRGAERLLSHGAARWKSDPGLWEALLHPEDREATLRRNRQALREMTGGELAYRLLGADGGSVWVRDVLHRETDPATGTPRMRGVMINISRQREAEQEREDLLRDQLEPAALERKAVEDSLRLLADAGAELGTLLEPEASARNVATLATRDLADWCLVLTRSERDGIRAAAFSHRDPDKRELGAELSRLLAEPGGVPFGASAVLATGEPQLLPAISSDSFEPGAARSELMRVIRGLGAESAMAVPLPVRHRDAGSPGAPASEQVLGAIVFVSASTQRRYSPHDLLVAELLGRRAALALANARLYQEAQEAVRQREEFLSIAAHELRTPLATLQLTTQSTLLVLDHKPLDLEFLRTRALAGERQTQRLSRLINDLLDISAIKAGRMRIQRERMDLVAAVQAVLLRMSHELARKGIDVTVHAPAPVLGRWDPDRLEQVITNLLSNAVKYGDQHPVRIAVLEDADRAILEVADEGIGMTAEVRARLFQAFERGLSSDHYGGLGLGLYITAQILRAHGGTISVRSTPGEGSTFTVELPRKPETPETPANAPRRESGKPA
jgi:signal transduction histidine kinase